MKKYSADKLLKKQPKKLKKLRFEDNGSGDLYVKINEVVIFANSYEIAYCAHSVVLRFFNNKTLVATASVFGSTDAKGDEIFAVDDYRITSETSCRVMKDYIDDAKKKNK